MNEERTQWTKTSSRSSGSWNALPTCGRPTKGTGCELFVADGSLVNPFGQRADGRKDVAAMYSE